MEKSMTIPTSGGFEISGILNFTEKSERLIIMVHGLTGSMSEAHYYAAKEYFMNRGYSVFRFNLYGGKEKNRQLHSTTIAEHNEDVDTVLRYMQSQYKDMYLVGHSLAGPSIVGIASFPRNLQKIIFWDPAFDTSGTILRCFEKNGLWFFYPKNGKNIEISKNMYDEFVENTHLEQLRKLEFDFKNTHIIFAGNCDKLGFKNQTDTLGIESCIIEGANHGFTQEGKYDELFTKTLEYIEK